MKKISIILSIFFLTITLKAQNVEINWITFEEALTAQKESQGIETKKIMMVVYTNWCGSCKLLEEKTLHNADLVNYVNENFYAVKFNGEGKNVIKYKEQEFGNPHYDASKEFTHNSSHQFADYLQIRGYPTIVFFAEDASVLAPLPGYRTAKQLEVFLKLFKTDTYKEINTEEKFSKYQKKFVYEFKE